MRVAAVQFCPRFRDVEANLLRIEQWIAEIDADLIVFPELATCGYFFHDPEDARLHASEADGPQVQRIIDAAVKAGRLVVCGFPERDGNLLYNSALIGGKGLAPRIYRKTHLFYKEKQVFTPGDSGFFVLDLPGLDCRLGTMVCYDWRFPEAARTLALQGADVIVCPSNLVTHIWRSVMPVRAIENKTYLVVANRTGTETTNDEEVSFNGQSAIYGYNGQPLSSADPTEDAVLIAEIHPELTRDKSFNPLNDIFADRRPDVYL